MRKMRWFVFGVVLVLAGVLFFNRKTWTLYRDQAAIEKRNDQRMRGAEAERAKLMDKKADLESSVGQERMAREQGYKKPKEKPLELGP